MKLTKKVLLCSLVVSNLLVFNNTLGNEKIVKASEYRNRIFYDNSGKPATGWYDDGKAWYYFGEANIKYLFGKAGLLPYRAIVLICIVAGSLGEVAIVWSLADIFNTLMVIPNVIAILWLSFEARAIMKDYNKCLLNNDVHYDYEVK